MKTRTLTVFFFVAIVATVGGMVLKGAASAVSRPRAVETILAGN